MATKKVTAPKVVAEQPAKTAKTIKTATPVAAAKPVAKKVAAAPAPAAKKVETAAKAVKAPAKKTEAPVKAQKAAPAPVAAKAVATSKVTFTLPKEVAENAETVAVLGDFNNWQNGVALKKQKDGSFAAAVELEKGRSYEFRFLINGEKWENAPNAEAYKPTPFGAYNSVVTA